jgi:hypothetical protein
MGVVLDRDRSGLCPLDKDPFPCLKAQAVGQVAWGQVMMYPIRPRLPGLAHRACHPAGRRGLICLVTNPARFGLAVPPSNKGHD